MRTNNTIDDEDEAVTTAEARADAFESDTAFVAAMSRAIRRGREKVRPGTTIDRTPAINARRIRPAAAMSYMSSPAALCEEIGKRQRG